MNTKPPSERWIDLRLVTIAGIEEIDDATHWSEVEPYWWAEMLSIKRMLVQQLIDAETRGVPK